MKTYILHPEQSRRIPPLQKLYFVFFTCISNIPVVPLHHTVHMEHIMEILINIDDSTPLFAQLINQVKEAVLKGEIKPGAALPSIRQLANDLHLNSKTVAKAYRLLERDSVIQTKGYRGTFIHPEAVANSTVDLNKWVETRLSETIAAFRESGVTDSEIRIAFGTIMSNRNN